MREGLRDSSFREHWFPALRARRILVVGDVMHDIVVRPEGPLVRGADRRAKIQIVPGGSGANQALWLAHFGASQGISVRLAARVGAGDEQIFGGALKQSGIEACLGADAGRQSGTLVCIVDADGERSFLTDRGANEALCESDLPISLLDDVGLLHVSAYSLFSPGPRKAVLHLVERALQSGVPVSLDPASSSFLAEVGAAAFLSWTKGVTFLFPNEDEAAVLSGSANADRQLSILSKIYPIIALKQGRNGARFYRAQGALDVSAAAPPVVALDSTGAGDAFLASFLVNGLIGIPAETCLKRAVLAGSEAVRQIGGQPPCHDEAQTQPPA